MQVVSHSNENIEVKNDDVEVKNTAEEDEEAEVAEL